MDKSIAETPLGASRGRLPRLMRQAGPARDGRDADMKKVRLNLYIDLDVARALDGHCARTGASMSGGCEVLLRKALEMPPQEAQTRASAREAVK